jgi:hypothetical protein
MSSTTYLREEIAFAMVKWPSFDPSNGDTRPVVFQKLRTHLANMKLEWWGGDALFERMKQLIDEAEGTESEMGLKALGEVYTIVTQTPRSKEAANDAA